MKFSCNRNIMSEALGLVGSVIPSRASKPVLQNVQIKGNSDSTVTLSGTDLEIGISLNIPVDNMTDPQTTLLSVHNLAGVVSEEKSENLEFEVNEDMTRMIAGKGKFEFSAGSEEEFPEIKSIGDDHVIEIKADDLIDAVHRTSFATAKGDSRYALNGVCINVEGSKAEFVSSDTHRLSLVTKKIENPANVSGMSIVITKGMIELARMATGEETVKIQMLSNEIVASTSRATLISRLVEGQFPRYHDVIPSDTSIKIAFNRDEVMHGLRLVGKMSSEESHSVKFDAANNRLVLSAVTGSLGSGNKEFDAIIEGGEMSSSFNYVYMIDALKSMTSKEVSLNLRSNGSPIKIIEDDYTHVVMPITTNR